MVDRPDPGRGVRRSLDGQEPSDPYLVELVARAAKSSSQDLLARATGRRGSSAARLESARRARPTHDSPPGLGDTAAQLDASARRIVASWAGHALVKQMVGSLRPTFRAALAELAIENPGDPCAAAVRVLGIGPVRADGTEEPDPFASWPEERLAPARLVTSRIRVGLAQLVDSLRADEVTTLRPVESAPPSEGAPDGLAFGFAHVALLLLLWLDVRLDGRSGAQIAASLPMLGAVDWERMRATLLVGAAGGSDSMAADIFRRSGVVPWTQVPPSSERSYELSVMPVPEALRDYLEANRPRSTDPQHDVSTPTRRKRHRGRPRGTRYLTKTAVFRANRLLDADAAADRLRTRDGRVRRYTTISDLADKVDAPLGTLKDFLGANNLNWHDRARWPPE